MNMATRIGGVGTLVLLIGCVGVLGSVQLRAASDFRCGRGDVIVTPVGGSAYRAEGCGREATYVCVRSDGGSRVVCTRDSEIETTLGMETEVAEMDEVRRVASPLCRAVTDCIGLEPVMISYDHGTATDIDLSPGATRTCVARAVLSHPSPEADGDVHCPSLAPAPVPTAPSVSPEHPPEPEVPAAEPDLVISDDSCTSDADCVPAGCCHAAACVGATSGTAPACEETMCTMDCQFGTLDCGGSCLCHEGHCAARLSQPPAGVGSPLN